MTIEQIENDYWPDYDFETSLIRKCHNLRKIEIDKLSTEDVRLLLGQNIGNKIIIPLALDILKINILAEGNYFQCDLLLNLLNSDTEFWKENKNTYNELVGLINKNIRKIQILDTTKEIKEEIFIAMKEFSELSKEWEDI